MNMMIPAVAAAQQERPRFTPEQIHRYERETTPIDDFAASGLILDLGGGGEGVIGQMKRSQVVAIDLSRKELEEAPGGPLLKIVMDATELRFLNSVFQTVTCFYTLMFVPLEKQLKVLEEARRVLAPGGRMLIWDVEVPPPPSPEKKVGIFYFTFQFPGQLPGGPAGREVRTGYGTLYGEAPRGAAHYQALARQAGFQLASSKTQGRSFFLELQRT